MATQLEFWPDEPGSGSTQPEESKSIHAQAPEFGAVKEPHWDTGTVDDLRKTLSDRSGMEVLIKVTRHTSTLLRVAHESGGTRAKLSLHWIFLDAPEAVVTALARWVRNPRRIRRDGVIRAYMNANMHRIPPARHWHTNIMTKGAHYDLREVYDEINSAEFGDSVRTPITWGRWQPGGKGRATHFRFGSFCPLKNIIRINPVLDSPNVPRFVIRSIVFHEMLHAEVGIERGDTGRRRIHHAEFRARERRHADYLRAEEWINDPKNLRMLRRRRRALRASPETSAD